MSWVMSSANIPQTITESLLALTQDKILLLLIINALLLVVGCFMDMTPAVLTFTPILLPVVMSQFDVVPAIILSIVSPPMRVAVVFQTG